MAGAVRVKIGDTIEFATTPTASSLFTTGRVMDVNPAEPELCTVQLSPYEPLQLVDLSQCAHKIVYAVGDISLLTPRMAGWKIEIATDAQVEEPAVIKRVDLDINCALVAFESGKKEWLDLTLSAFKVVVQPASNPPKDRVEDLHGHDAHTPHQATQETVTESSSVSERERSIEDLLNNGHPASQDLNTVPTQQTTVIPTSNLTGQTPRTTNLAIDFKHPVRASSVPPPSTDVTGFDWYTEGGHVELCDSSGTFLEGAILCSKTDTHVQLYNETRQFFEILMRAQSFKVVIHGLLSLKCIPMGQMVEVYSAMAGSFQCGTVIKTAEVGKLTPVRSDSSAVEWLDLSTQTFKLVFLSNRIPEDQHDTEIDSPSRILGFATNRHSSHNHLSHHRHHRATTPLEAPALVVGQRIEIFENASRLFVKFKVTTVRDGTDPIEYEFTSQSPSTSSSIGDQTCCSSLVNLRCRIPLKPFMWGEYRRILPGHRVDIYDKSTKSVLNGKILEIGSHENGHSMLVRFKDGKKDWIHSHDVKLKLRLSGDPLDARRLVHQQLDSPSGIPAANEINSQVKSDPVNGESIATQEWPMQPAPFPEADREENTPAKAHLLRHFNDVASTGSIPQDDAAQEAYLTHSASTSDSLAPRSIEIDAVTMAQTIPSIVQPLDFSNLRRLRSAADIPVPNSGFVHGSNGEQPANSSEARMPVLSARHSEKADSAPASSRGIPFSLDDVWREDRDSDTGAVAYVHVASGARRSQRPEWLERHDPSTGRLFVIHTSTSTLYSLPSSKPDVSSLPPSASAISSARANSSAPGSSLASPSTIATTADTTSNSGSSRVVVPVGAIEAVRVFNMLS